MIIERQIKKETNLLFYLINVRKKSKCMNPDIKKNFENNAKKPLYVNNPSLKILEKIEKISISEVKKQFKKPQVKDNILKINIWKISPKIFLIGEVWDGETNFLDCKNFTGDVQKYLEKTRLNNNYLYYTTNENTKLSGSILRLKKILYDCNFFGEISNSIYSWLQLSDTNVAFIEVNYEKLTLFAILIECVNIYLTEKINIGLIFSNFEHFKKNITDLNTIDRYKKYFYNLYCKKNDRLATLKLHQIIISNYPKIEGFDNFKISFSIHQNQKNITKTKDVDDIDIIYKDNFYIVLNNLNMEITDDINFTIDFINKDKKKTIFEFPFNVFFYDQGVFRYNKEDVLTDIKSKFQDEFNFDLVFLETENYINLSLYENKYNIIQGIITINELFKRNKNDSKFEMLFKKGYEKNIATFCSLLNYSNAEASSLISLLETKGYTSLFSQGKSLKTTFIHFQKTKNTEEYKILKQEDIIPIKPFDKDNLYKNILNKDLPDIELIKDEEKPSLILKNPTKKFVLKKKKILVENVNEMNCKALRPLHWVPINDNDGTIFKDLDIYKSKLDVEKFKKYFCVNSKDTEHINNNQLNQAVTVIDQKRLFLVSLAISHLNKKNINPKNIYDMLINNPKDIFIQDLLNLEHVFPTYEETYVLANYDFSKLMPEEKIMLEYSKLLEVKKIVKILLFERKFFDEIFLIENLLEKIKFTFDKIIESKDFKIILKMILDIGNLINYDFSARKKKSAGFMLSSIYLFVDYKGHEDYSLFQFFMESMEYNSISINLQRDFKYLNIIRKEQIIKIKEKINFLIKQYKDNLQMYYTLENDKATFTNFFLFVADKLTNIKSNYEKCTEKIVLIKKLFNEDDKRSIIDMLDCIAYLISKITNYKQPIYETNNR